MLEVAVKIEDMGFGKTDIENSDFQILQTRFSPDYVYDSARMMNFDNKDKYIPVAVLNPFGGNELSVLRVHDPIRNYNRFSFSFLDVMEKDFIENHVFKLDSVTIINDQYVYCIKFSKKNITKTSLGDTYGSRTSNININFKPIYQVNGTIFISADDYAIHKIIYTNYYKQSKIKDYLYNLTVEYKKYQEKMFLNYLSFSNYFEMADLSDSSYFKIDSALYIDQPGYNECDLVRVFFNHYVDTISALKKADYLIVYNDKKVKIDSISIDTSNINLYIIPPKSAIKPDNWFTVVIKDLKDVMGNTIEVKKKFSMYQYREFFVNNIETQNYKSIPYNFTMPKNSPIYFLKKDDDPDFWENYNYIRRKGLLK